MSNLQNSNNQIKNMVVIKIIVSKIWKCDCSGHKKKSGPQLTLTTVAGVTHTQR